jgi:hypothetical protein
MRIATIGPGGMGDGIGHLLARAGHEVVFSGTRSPEKLARAAASVGPNTRTAALPEAVDEAEAVVIAVPFDRYGDIAEAAGEALRGKVVIDTSNPITVRDGRVEFLEIDEGMTAAEHQQRTLADTRLVKAFNAICASEIEELAEREGDERVAILLAGDDEPAKETAMRLIVDAHFTPVDVGALADASVLEPTSVEDVLPVLTEAEAGRLVRDRVTPEKRGHRGRIEMSQEGQERSDLEDPACADEVALSGLALAVRRAAFRWILATGQPWDPDGGSVEGASMPAVRSAVDQLLEAGRARTDHRGRVTASGGLCVDPTPHRIQTNRGARWTQCAYDALGILGALGEDGTIETTSPSTGAPIRVRFVDGSPAGSEAVLFLADQSTCCRPNDDWCPNVNLFEDRRSAQTWGEEHGIAGRVLALREATELGAMEWRPLIGDAAGPHT